MSTHLLEAFKQQALVGKSESTQKTYMHALQQFNDWLEGVGTDLEGFSQSDVQQYIDELTVQRKGASTIHKIWHAIKAFSRWSGHTQAIEDIRVIKMADIKQQAPKGLNRIERNRVIREVDRSGNRRDYAIIILLLYTGLRVRELVSLDRNDIQISDRKGSVRVMGKGNQERHIPLNAEARRALTIDLEKRKDDYAALFLSNRKRRISVRSVQTILEKYGVHPHQLRHTFITSLVRSGEDLSVIQSLSGHQSVDMILRYSQPTEEDKKEAVENIYLQASD